MMTRHLALILFCVAAFPAGAGPLPEPITESMFASVDPEEARLGQLLFYDPILSGNRNVACATCHHPDFATSDGLALGLGDGGIGRGSNRRVDPENVPPDRIPRNSPALFNLGAAQFTVLFHDGRIEVDKTRASGFRTPLDEDMLDGFASLLSAQTMFPVLSADEMAGHYVENDVARAVRQGLITGDGGAWDILARRVSAIPEYADSFMSLYDHISQPGDISFADISNAIAVFVAYEWRSDSAPFDAILRVKEAAIPDLALQGMDLFYGAAGCGTCHTGPFLTDHRFHAMGAPQLGPGKVAAFEDNTHDLGRFRVTGNAADAFAFRTPSLRNVTLTGPWGHAGGHASLAEFVQDHLDPQGSAARFSADGPARRAVPLSDFDAHDWTEMDDPEARDKIVKAASVRPLVQLEQSEVTALVAFLALLEDPAALSGRLGIPATVPSGLPVGGLIE
jgi:cytochrome c peroxidase